MRDQANAPDHSTLTITVTGVNDAAVIGAPAVATVTEDASVVAGKLVAEGTLSITDVDAGEASFQTVVTPAAGTLGALTLGADGTYTYAVDNSAVQSLGKDQTKVETFTVKSLDGTTKDISFTITGVNDAAVIGTPAVNTVTEDANVVGGKLVAEGKLAITDVDAGEASFQTVVTQAAGTPALLSVAAVTPTVGTLGTLTIAADGTYRYAVDNSAVQYLGKDQTKVETFTVKSLDGTTKDISFTITGVNDAAVVGNQPNVHLYEDAVIGKATKLTAAGKLTVSDADAGQASFQTGVQPANGSLGVLTLASDGTYSYAVDNAAVQYLAAGQTKVDSFIVKTFDGTEKVLNFTLHGRNDAAIIGLPPVRDVTEDAGVSASGKLTAAGVLSITDVDQGQASFLTSVTGARSNLGTLTLASDGHYSYAVDNKAVQFLRSDETRVDSFTVTSLDGTRKTVSFTIHGADEPVAPREVLYHNELGRTQWLNGTSNNDVFVVHGNSRDYNAGPTQDGKGIVVWNGRNFDILKGFEVLRFDDKDVKANASGQFDIHGQTTGTGEKLYQNVAGVQHLTGTSAQDVFVVGAKEAGYHYNKAQDGIGIVVWKGMDFDILHGFETIRFTDHDVQIASIV